MDIKFDKREAREVGLVAAAIFQALRDDGEIRLPKVHSDFVAQELDKLEQKNIISRVLLVDGYRITWKREDIVSPFKRVG